MSRHDYRDVNIKTNNWAEIGTLLHVTGQQTREKWKELRDRFVKIKNKNESSMRSGAPGGVSTNKWSLFEQMSFLDSFVQHRKLFSISYFKTSSNLDLVTLSAVVEGEEVSGSSSVAPTPKKRKEEVNMRILKFLRRRRMDDPDKLFLLSLLPQLKRLSPERASSTKMKTMQILHEAEFEK
uniref:uncharacterized protein LOC120345568 n=1 Tax=Styela clava TaxID=7725 RepID=UPI001939C690|nr:uncharacterized protein LOC120345568 [Styela clava]